MDYFVIQTHHTILNISFLFLFYISIFHWKTRNCLCYSISSRRVFFFFRMKWTKHFKHQFFFRSEQLSHLKGRLYFALSATFFWTEKLFPHRFYNSDRKNAEEENDNYLARFVSIHISPIQVLLHNWLFRINFFIFRLLSKICNFQALKKLKKKKDNNKNIRRHLVRQLRVILAQFKQF